MVAALSVLTALGCQSVQTTEGGVVGVERRLHRVLGRHLVAHQRDGFRTRADEHEAAAFDALGEVRVLRQEAVAGMDGVDAGDGGVPDLPFASGRANLRVRRSGRVEVYP